ncbi:MBL fold metallo-hydrolase [Gottfriedia luciferensis]|uniref:MBL fold metallo-hydrolase n=1 Tax=Gottfriedia luciferensis TaxID=178774 RepID=UPI000B42F4A5|nr:MBL fold metallo-hydrolase [Gottfriedia luciferensis]
MLFLLCLVLIVIIIMMFLNTYPHFGKKYSKEQMGSFNTLDNYKNGKFINQIPTSMNMNFKTNLSMIRDFVKKSPNRTPKDHIPMEKIEASTLFNSNKGDTKITWFGHSALLIEIEGKNILVDPMFGNTPTPFPQFGGKRYSGGLPIEISDLPKIDAVILSHDHYDHLDYGTIKKIKQKVDRFIVPLGVGSHLESWGVSRECISEHNWWDEFRFEHLTLACTPARHFSGRSLTDRNATLWCSWVILSEKTKIYFSGDSGYAPHFKEIGEKYGPFDIAFMECGQYDARWSVIHMLPEETVKAFTDVKGEVLVPIHFGAFTLAFHDWNDPIERAVKAAKENGVKYATPKIGETINLTTGDFPSSIWWK